MKDTMRGALSKAVLTSVFLTQRRARRFLFRNKRLQGAYVFLYDLRSDAS